MSDKQSFSCLLRPEERKVLRQMADLAERSESAMVRTLIREAARVRGLLPATCVNTNNVQLADVATRK